MQLIPRLYDVFDGSVKVGGVDVRDYKIESLRSAIGVVLQKNVLFSGTIKQNLLWGNPNATDEEINTLSNYNNRSVSEFLFQARANRRVGSGINRACGIVQNHYLGLFEQRARDTQALLLSAGNIYAALTQIVIKSAGESVYKLFRTSLSRGTGSGKTSLVSLIPRLYDATAGTVKVGGVDVKDYNLDVLRNKVAMVLQKNVLFSGTVAENLRWGDENATEEELRFAARQACDSFACVYMYINIL